MILKLRFSGGTSLFAKQEKTVFTSGSRRRFDTAAVVDIASIPAIMVSTLKDEICGVSFELLM